MLFVICVIRDTLAALASFALSITAVLAPAKVFARIAHMGIIEMIKINVVLV